MTGYQLGSGIAVTENRMQNYVSIHITDEELARNAAVRAAVRVIGIHARNARTVIPAELPTGQPTQPTPTDN